MKWFVVFIGVMSLCILCAIPLVVYQFMPNTVISYASPQHHVIHNNAEVISERTAILNLKGNTIEQSEPAASNSNNNHSLKQSSSDSSSEVHNILKKTRLDVSKDGSPLLTLFTTLKNAPDRFEIHSNMLKNWAMFQPYIIPILYTHNTDMKLVELARKLGWEILPIPATNSFGTPYLKPMYREAKKRYASVFYGFANADLLFEYGLLDTLKVVTGCLDQLKQTMIVGRRTNFKIDNRTVFKPDEVKQITKKEGKIFRYDAEDYFLVANDEFPWYKVPDIVVGRPAYDNFLVATAWMSGVSVIDASNTLIALHQSGNDGDFSGHARSKDIGHNNKVIGNFDFTKGLTINAQFETLYGKTDEIELWHRVVKWSPRRYKVIGKTKKTSERQSNSDDNPKVENAATKPQGTPPLISHISKDSRKIEEAVKKTVESSVDASKENLSLLAILKSLENSKNKVEEVRNNSTTTSLPSIKQNHPKS